jgi:hypothetical protein
MSSEMAALETLGGTTGADTRSVVDVCKAISQAFLVQQNEVALLRMEGQRLSFLFPLELRAAESIPVSSNATAAHTASTRLAECFNNFVELKLHGVFEQVKVGADTKAHVIQKLMSAPVTSGDGTVLGLIQVSRKGNTPTEAGADFSPDDLETLTMIGTAIAKIMPRLLPR